MKKKTAPKVSTKRTSGSNSTTKILPFDFASWNFIIFLVLALILVVFVAIFMKDRAQDLRAKAGLECPQITELPRPEDCPGGEWKFRRMENGCSNFSCDAY